MKKIMVILSVWSCCFLFGGCLSQNTESQLFDVETSIFDSYEMEQTETNCVIKGRISQKSDDNAVVVTIQAEDDTMINVSGTLEKVSGSNTELVYTSSDGEKTVIADHSSDTFEAQLNVSEGEGKIVFTGETAVYDFEIELELAEEVSYGMTIDELKPIEPISLNQN